MWGVKATTARHQSESRQRKIEAEEKHIGAKAASSYGVGRYASITFIHDCSS